MESNNGLTLQQKDCIDARQLREIAERLHRHYLSDDAIYKLFMGGGPQGKRDLEVLRYVYHSILVSLNFGETRRAVWYIGCFLKLCKEFLSHERMEKVDCVFQSWLENDW